MLFSILYPKSIFLERIDFMYLGLFSKSPKDIQEFVGRQTLVTKAIATVPGETGMVRIDGDEWPAYTIDASPIPENTRVFIHAICGIRVLVATSPPPSN